MACVGIDLGTTNSLVAVYRDNGVSLVPNALGDDLTPSAVSIDDEGDLLVGKAACERLSVHPDRTAILFKRAMGTDRVFRLADREFRAEELSAIVLRSLKADAEAYLGQPITEAVISVPAYFNDAQRKATKAAGALAGLQVDRLINEPTAAAIAYGLHKQDEEATVLVFDLGGGTFDVSILELFEGIMEVRSTAGDAFLGGEDFVEALAGEFAATRNIKLNSLSHVDRARLRNAMEAAKLQLTVADTASVEVKLANRPQTWSVTRSRFEQIAKPLIDRMWLPVERSLRDSGLTGADLDAVLLVGGATRTPFLRRTVGRLLGQIPSTHLDADKVVAMGAAVQAALIAREEAVEDRVLTDVCPFTLGIEHAVPTSKGSYIYGRYAPIIERNTVVPASRSEVFATLEDDQPMLRVAVFQGESYVAENNVHLGEMEIPMPAGPAGEQWVDVRFTYDVNGLLEVETTVGESGEKRRMVIEGNPGVLSSEEIEARFRELASLKLHPRDQIENRTLLARAERIYEECLGDDRAFIAEAVDQFEAVLQTQSPDLISEARGRLCEYLDAVENSWVTA